MCTEQCGRGPCRPGHDMPGAIGPQWCSISSLANRTVSLDFTAEGTQQDRWRLFGGVHRAKRQPQHG